jgi:hypothetical protein
MSFFGSHSKKRAFCFALFFKHLRVGKMCGASKHRMTALLKTAFHQRGHSQWGDTNN